MGPKKQKIKEGKVTWGQDQRAHKKDHIVTLSLTLSYQDLEPLGSFFRRISMFCSQEILPHLGPETDSCMGIGEINCDVGWGGRHDF